MKATLLHSLLIFLFLPFLVLCSSHYETLGIKKDATESEIKKAYRALAMKWHPDKATEKDRDEATKQFQKISEAYEVLSNKDQRRQYDQMRDANSGSGMPNQNTRTWNDAGGAPGGWGSTTSSGRGNEQQFNFNHKSPDEVFKEFFGTDNPFDKLFEGGGLGNVGGGQGGSGGSFTFMNSDILSSFGGGATGSSKPPSSKSRGYRGKDKGSRRDKQSATTSSSSSRRSKSSSSSKSTNSNRDAASKKSSKTTKKSEQRNAKSSSSNRRSSRSSGTSSRRK